MNRIRLTRARGFALAIALLTSTAIPAAAQSGGPAADRLSEQVRILASNPRDLDALITAGQLSAKLGDTAAALAFLARAEAIDPNEPRTFAGRGTALVQMEKPGEALRMFNEAEKRGLPVSAYAADRGFTYDLLGAPELAQRDYRVALQTSNDDDTVRRLALSLGISGRGDEAMTLLDPLLRRSDRPAWRARAFILAMTGDVPGAEKIAASMMPGTMGASLTPFFRKLPTLGAADRAFAVHFGELTPTAARLADARTAPPLPAYTPSRPVVAAAAPPPTTAVVVPLQKNDRRSRRQREEDERKALAAARVTPAPAPVVVAAATPPALEPPRYQPQMVQSVPTASQGSYGAPSVQTATRPPVQLATRDAVRMPQSVLPAESDTRVRPDSVQTQPTPRPFEPRPAAADPAPRPFEPRPVSSEPAPRVVEPRPAPTEAAPQPAVLPPAPRVVEAPRPAPPRPAPVRTPPRKPDRSLASIVDNLDVPAEEKAVEAVPPTKGKPGKTEPTRAEPAKPARTELAKLSKAELARLSKAERAKLKAQADAEEAGKDEKAAKGKKSARDDKKDKKPDPAKAEPSRIWVQVAGGANEKALPTAWAKLAKDTPSLKGRSAYVTPLRATNRLLTGPFKSDDEAQAYVKKLRGEGLQAFQFTSDAGQKINKLGAGGAAADDNAEDTADKKAPAKKAASKSSDKPAKKKGGKKR